MVVVIGAHHLHVDASLNGLPRRVAGVDGIAVLDQFVNRCIVADDEALKVPFLAQHLP